MRFQRLELIKYGKFSGLNLNFPAAAADFHLIVGANEAGKSTLRCAIADLLFGIPHRSPFGFLHPLNELRLGAEIAAGGESLYFQRAKAQKQTLRALDDSPLPDGALHGFLGDIDKNFFEQMFGLDHDRLVAGGNSILQAENDVGQILFQSAAGITSLKAIREQYKAEADKLWGPNKAAGRAYYSAHEQFKLAEAALKQHLVSAKAWEEARREAEDLQTRLELQNLLYRQAETRRGELERVRRLAPFAAAIRDAEHKIAALGPCAELPADAAEQLQTAERELAVAAHRLRERQAESVELKRELAQTELDADILPRAASVNSLAEQSIRCGAYASEISKLQYEVNLLWQDCRALCAQLGWPAADADALEQRLPNPLQQRELRELLRRHSQASQALSAAEQAARAKQIDIEALEQRLAPLQRREINPLLPAALGQAKALGDAEALLRKLIAAQETANAELTQALARLGPARALPLAELIALDAPSADSVNRLLQQQQERAAKLAVEDHHLQQAEQELARLELLIQQYAERHQPISLAQVLQARERRDALWQAVKRQPETLASQAADFESATAAADQIADKRFADAAHAAEFQSLNQQLERERQTLEQIRQRRAELQQELERPRQDWEARMRALKLDGLPLEEYGAWLMRREQVVTAQQRQQQALRELAETQQNIVMAQNKLLHAMHLSGINPAAAASLSELAAVAERACQDIDTVNRQLDELKLQQQAAVGQRQQLRQNLEQAAADFADWQTQWRRALLSAGLPPDSAITAMDGILETITQLTEKLTNVKRIQEREIAPRQTELQAFTALAQRLAAELQPELSAHPPERISAALSARLETAQQTARRREQWLQSLEQNQSQARAAEEAGKLALAAISPLQHKAQTEDLSQLAAAIARSDALRQYQTQIAAAEQQLLNNGDGLDRARIEAEIAAADLSQLEAELQIVSAELSDALSQVETLSAQRNDAQRRLQAIAGDDDAARAEARRQAALADMAEAAERYIKLTTAERLLRWAMERYRAEKQGPLLQRAGAIFAALTLGNFSKLVVEFESNTLEGMRAEGKLVGVSGMSDGARDQLYLALRLAALELHLAQSKPLPFIADDLFINYDDHRALAGFKALYDLAGRTQVIYLTHHAHLVPLVREAFGDGVNVVWLG